MAIRMSQKQWRALSISDKEVLKTLNILDLVKPLANKPQASPKVFPEPYILHKIFTCSVCETTFNIYFKMLPFPKNPWALQAKKITFEDILPTNIIRKEKEFCSGCSHCYEVLGKESKKELIKRIIALAK